MLALPRISVMYATFIVTYILPALPSTISSIEGEPLTLHQQNVIMSLGASGSV